MKKILLGIITCFVCVGVLVSVAVVSTACKKKKALVLEPEIMSAEDVESAKHFTFSKKTYNGVSGYKVISYKGGLDENCVIPTTYKGLNVLEIERRCFADYQNKNDILSVTLPSKLLIIGNAAFNICYGLSGNLIIPNSVTTIGDLAFNACKNINGKLTIPNSVTTLGGSAFQGCTGLTDLEIGNSVTTIKAFTFYGCTGLSGELNIPNSVNVIGERAFYECSGLTGTLIIPNSVTTIESCAFDGCSKLTGLVIGNSVETIKNSAFSRCAGLTGTLTIPEAVTTIENSAFSGCSNLNTMIIDSESIANQLTDISVVRFILSNCMTLYLKEGIAATEYVTIIYSVATSDKTGYTKYVKN